MGGLLSGTWTRCRRKPLVENALALNVADLKRAGLLAPEAEGRMSWTVDEQAAATAEIYVGPECDGLKYLFVQGVFGSFGDEQHGLRLEASSLWHGGRRWWLLCPFCDGRFGKLFWQKARRHFLCRSCAGLTYYSSRVAHQRERMFCMIMQMGAKSRRSSCGKGAAGGKKASRKRGGGSVVD